MRRGFKPYNKRKPFKRKVNGGQRFMLNGGRYKDVSFDTSSLDKNAFAGMSSLISLILTPKRIRSSIKTGNKEKEGELNAYNQRKANQ